LQAVISVETLTSVKALLAQGPPAYEADPQEAALRAFVAQHGLQSVLASPELRGQLVSNLAAGMLAERAPTNREG